MANEQGLKVLLQAELNDFLKDMKAAKDAIVDTASSTAEAVKSFLGFSASAEEASKSAGDLAGALNEESTAANTSAKSWNQLGKFIFEQTYQRKTMIQQINQGVGSWKLEAKAIDDAGNSVSKTGTKNANTTRTLHDLSNVLVQSTTSGVGLERGLIRLVEAFDFTQKSAGGFGAGLKALGAAMIGPSGVILGVSALLTGATELIKKYGSLGNAINALNPFLSEQAKVQNDINAAMLQNANTVNGELAKLDLLFKSAKDLNIPLAERKRITDELIKQYPDTFNGLTTEAIAAGKADAAYKSLTKTLLAQAAVKAGNDVIAEQGKDMLQLRLEADELQKKLKDLQQNGNKGSLLFGKSVLENSRDIAGVQNSINANKAKQLEIERKTALVQQEQLKLVEQFGVKTLGIGGATDVTKIAAQLKNALSEVDKKAELTGETAKKVAQEKLSLLSKAFDEIANIGGDKAKPILQDIGNQMSKLQGVADAKKVKTVADVLKELNASLAATDAQAKTFGGTFDSLAKEKVAALNKAFDQLVKLGLQPTSPEIKKIADQIKYLESVMIGSKSMSSEQLIQFDGKKMELAEQQIVSLRDQIMKLLNQGFTPASKEVATLQSKLGLLINEVGDKPIIDPDNFEIVDNKLKAVVPALQNAGNAWANFINKTNTASATLGNQTSIVSDNLMSQITGVKLITRQQFDSLNADMQKQVEQYSINLDSAMGSAFSGLGETIGNALGNGGGLQTVFQGVLGLFAGFIKQLGESMIAAGTAMVAAKFLIKNPVTAIAAGVAAVAISSLLQKQISNAFPSFATGGVVNGPTLAMVGDNPSGVEYMIPKEVLDKLGGNNGFNGRLTARIAGTDLEVVLTAAEAENNRYGYGL